MSLPVGTLVLIVRSARDTHMNGKVGEIVGGLQERFYPGYQWKKPSVCYLVKVEGFPSPLPGGLWAAVPPCVFPITPPGRADDVTADRPVDAGVSA